MTTRNTIVVGIDGTSVSERAADWAATEAERRHADLEIVHAFSMPIVASQAQMVMSASLTESLRINAAELLADARATVAAAHPTAHITTRLMERPASLALREAGRDAVMTVVGARVGHHEFSDALFGSVATSVAEYSADPVVVVRPPAGEVPTRGPIVVALDGSPDSDAALAFALEEASLRGVELIAVHAWTQVSLPTDEVTNRMALDTVRQSEERLLAEQLAGWDEKYPDVQVRRHVRRGPASEVVMAICRDQGASLVVTGSRGRSGVAAVVLGSTSRSLLAWAPCPVAVFRGTR